MYIYIYIYIYIYTYAELQQLEAQSVPAQRGARQGLVVWYALSYTTYRRRQCLRVPCIRMRTHMAVLSVLTCEKPHCPLIGEPCHGHRAFETAPCPGEAIKWDKLQQVSAHKTRCRKLATQVPPPSARVYASCAGPILSFQQPTFYQFTKTIMICFKY